MIAVISILALNEGSDNQTSIEGDVDQSFSSEAAENESSQETEEEKENSESSKELSQSSNLENINNSDNQSSNQTTSKEGKEDQNSVFDGIEDNVTYEEDILFKRGASENFNP
jgi:hypothetical protein